MESQSAREATNRRHLVCEVYECERRGNNNYFQGAVCIRRCDYMRHNVMFLNRLLMSIWQKNRDGAGVVVCFRTKSLE